MSSLLPLGSIVDGAALLDMLWSSVAAGLGVTAAYAIAISGAAKAVDASRERRSGEALLYGGLSVIALAAVVAAVILTIVVMIDK